MSQGLISFGSTEELEWLFDEATKGIENYFVLKVRAITSV
jgi:hypothetical protein